MRLLTIGLLLVLAGCASPANTSSQSPVPHQTAISTTEPSASPGASANLPTCRLPVSRGETAPDNPYFVTKLSGGFIDLPSGVYSGDPHGGAILDPASPGGRAPSVFMTAAQPILRGNDSTTLPVGPMTYDRAFGRWLPVPTPSVSPDGSRYVFVDTQQRDVGLPLSRIHLIDVASGTERVFTFPGPDLATITQYLAGVVAYSTEGVYLTLMGSNQGFGPDTGKLWLLDLQSGSISKITDVQGNWSVANGYAWSFVPSPGTPGPFPNQLVRLDLAHGGVSTWWVDSTFEPVSSAGAVTALNVLGVDGTGNPIVEGVAEVGPGSSYQRHVEIWTFAAPEQARSLSLATSDSDGPVNALTSEGAVTDSFGTWIAFNDRLFLYTAKGSLVRVGETGSTPAGPCA